MGMNYYIANRHGTPIKEMHIGKSSQGWAFMLHVIPELGLNTLGDWVNYLVKYDLLVVNEYKDPISIKDLIDIIVNRKREKEEYSEEFLVKNSAVLGKNNLLYTTTAELTGGTFQYIAEDFS